MLCLNKNKRKFYYQLLTGTTEVVDSDNNYTGEIEPTYASPVEFLANISADKGENQIEIFGTFEDYNKVIVTNDLTCPIEENSVLFIDRVPTYDNLGNLTNSYDYIVKRKSKSLNTIAFAIKKVR